RSRSVGRGASTSSQDNAPAASKAARKVAVTATRTRSPAADVTWPTSDGATTTLTVPPSPWAVAARSVPSRCASWAMSTGSWTGRMNESRTSLSEVSTSSCSIAASAKLDTVAAGASGRADRARITSRFTASPLSAFLTSCVAGRPSSYSRASHSAATAASADCCLAPSPAAAVAESADVPITDGSLAGVRVVRCRLHRRLVGVGHGQVLLGRPHELLHVRRGTADGQLLEEEAELVVVGTAD